MKRILINHGIGIIFLPHQKHAAERTAAWEQNVRTVVSVLRKAVEANNACDQHVVESFGDFAAKCTSLVETFEPRYVDATARTADWEENDAETCAKLRKQVQATGNCLDHVGESFEDFRAKCAKLAADVEPYHAEAKARTADWEMSDADVCDILRASVVANNACNNAINESLGIYTDSSNDGS